MAVKSIFILSIYIKVEKIVRGYVNLAEKFTCSNTQAHIHIMDVQIDNVHDNRFACVSVCLLECPESEDLGDSPNSVWWTQSHDG